MSAPKGIAHLIIVGLFGGLSLLGILLLAVLERSIPDILTITASGVGFYLLGANAAAKNNPTPPPE